MRSFVCALFLLCVALHPAFAQDNCSVSVVINALGGVENPFNFLAIIGSEEAAAARGCISHTFTPPTSEDYEGFLNQAVATGSSVIVSVGFDMADATFSAAETWTNTTFAIVDFAYSTQLPNLVGIVFREDQAGFLMGILAGALDSEFSNIAGCLGGIPIPPVLKFCNGYRQGLLEECQSCSVLIEYVFSFTDGQLGREAADRFLGNGTGVPFGAGGGMGSGGILEFSKSGNPVMGVDADEYFSTFQEGNVDPDVGLASGLISSSVKRIEVAVRVTMLEVLDEITTSGTRVFDAAAGGVGFAPCHEGCAFISEEAQLSLDLGLEQLAQGILTTGVDQFTGDLALYSQNNTQQWLKILPTGILPPPLYGHTLNSFSNDSVIMVFGGQSSTAVDSFQNDVFVFDYSAAHWEILETAGDVRPAPRSNHISIVYEEDWLIMFGGNGPDNLLFTDTWLFNYPTSEWFLIDVAGTLPARSGMAAAIADDKLYVFGGSSESGIVLGDMWVLNLLDVIPGGAKKRQSISWQSITLLPEIEEGEEPIIMERRDHRGASNDTRLFFFGGELGSNQLTNEVLMFEITTNVIKRIAKNQQETGPPPLKGHAIAHFADDVYIFGGVSSQSVFNAVYRFNLFEFEWILLDTQTSFSPPAMTSGAITAITDTVGVNATRLVIYGGLSTSGAEQVIFFFGIPENPVEFLEWFSCKRESKFFAPSGSIDFVPTGDNDIYPISYKCDGFVDCDNLYDENSDCSPSIESIFIAFTVILSFLFAFTFFLIAFLIVKGNDKTVVTASRNFLFVSVIGAQLAYASLFMFFFKPTDGLCSAQIWLLALGFVTMFGPLLVKTYRIVKVFRTRNFFLKPLSDVELFGRLVLIYVPVIIFLFIIQFHGQPEAQLAKEPGDNCEEAKFHMLCKTDSLSVVAAAMIVYYAVLLIVGVVFAVMTRHVQTAFNESQYIALGIYNFFFLGSVGVPMFYLLDEQPEVRLIILALLVCLATTLFLCLLFFPKIYIISVGGQDAYDQKTSKKSVTVKTDPGTAFDD